ncbi:endo-beta-1,4-mannanase [Pelomyxa schiedti]|nr:endo-beta-1,4-mannanase [Pelomyxa schiedti]
MDTLTNLSAVGGNSLRYWLFVEGYSIPEFDSNGYVIGTDAAGTLISDLRRYLWTAQEQGITINFCLWNGAVLTNPNAINLFSDTAKLQSFIDNALVPIVKALSNETAMMTWEIINEPEGSVQIASDSEPCFDTIPLLGSGAGWTGVNLPMKNILQFVSMQTSAIHSADPKALVSVGSWSEKAMTDNWGYRNYYKDECLNKFGLSKATLDYYQLHSYDWQGKWNEHAAFVQSKADYGLDKPIVVAEFDEESGGGMTIEAMYDYVFDHGYDGAWAWTAEEANNFNGVEALKGEKTVDAISMPDITVTDYCTQTCSDIPPSTDYTCAQQASWGKCDESWMEGYFWLNTMGDGPAHERLTGTDVGGEADTTAMSHNETTPTGADDGYGNNHNTDAGGAVEGEGEGEGDGEEDHGQQQQQIGDATADDYAAAAGGEATGATEGGNGDDDGGAAAAPYHDGTGEAAAGAEFPLDVVLCMAMESAGSDEAEAEGEGTGADADVGSDGDDVAALAAEGEDVGVFVRDYPTIDYSSGDEAADAASGGAVGEQDREEVLAVCGDFEAEQGPAQHPLQEGGLEDNSAGVGGCGDGDGAGSEETAGGPGDHSEAAVADPPEESGTNVDLSSNLSQDGTSSGQSAVVDGGQATGQDCLGTTTATGTVVSEEAAVATAGDSATSKTTISEPSVERCEGGSALNSCGKFPAVIEGPELKDSGHSTNEENPPSETQGSKPGESMLVNSVGNVTSDAPSSTNTLQPKSSPLSNPQPSNSTPLGEIPPKVESTNQQKDDFKDPQVKLELNTSHPVQTPFSSESTINNQDTFSQTSDMSLQPSENKADMKLESDMTEAACLTSVPTYGLEALSGDIKLEIPAEVDLYESCTKDFMGSFPRVIEYCTASMRDLKSDYEEHVRQKLNTLISDIQLPCESITLDWIQRGPPSWGVATSVLKTISEWVSVAILRGKGSGVDECEKAENVLSQRVGNDHRSTNAWAVCASLLKEAGDITNRDHLMDVSKTVPLVEEEIMVHYFAEPIPRNTNPTVKVKLEMRHIFHQQNRVQTDRLLTTLPTADLAQSKTLFQHWMTEWDKSKSGYMLSNSSYIPPYEVYILTKAAMKFAKYGLHENVVVWIGHLTSAYSNLVEQQRKASTSNSDQNLSNGSPEAISTMLCMQHADFLRALLKTVNYRDSFLLWKHLGTMNLLMHGGLFPWTQEQAIENTILEYEKATSSEEIQNSCTVMQLLIEIALLKIHSCSRDPSIARNSTYNAFEYWSDTMDENRKESLAINLCDLALAQAVLERKFKQFKQAVIMYEVAGKSPLVQKLPSLWKEYAMFSVERKKLANARQIFTRAVSVVSDEEKDSLWNEFLQFEVQYGGAGISTIEQLKQSVFSAQQENNSQLSGPVAKRARVAHPGQPSGVEIPANVRWGQQSQMSVDQNTVEQDPMPPWNVLIVQLRNALDTSAFEIVFKLKTLQNITIKELQARRTELATTHKMKLAEFQEYWRANPRVDTVLKDQKQKELEQACQKELSSFDRIILQALDTKVLEQQTIMQKAQIPGFFPTSDPNYIEIQSRLLDFILEEYQQHMNLAPPQQAPPNQQQQQAPLSSHPDYTLAQAPPNPSPDQSYPPATSPYSFHNTPPLHPIPAPQPVQQQVPPQFQPAPPLQQQQYTQPPAQQFAPAPAQQQYYQQAQPPPQWLPNQQQASSPFVESGGPLPLQYQNSRYQQY